MSINPRSYRKTNFDEARQKKLRYFTIFLIIFVPLYFGYVGIKNISPKKDEIKKVNIETGDQPLEKEIKIVVKADGGLNFRKEADKDSEKIGRIPDGTKLTVKKEIDGWYFVNFEGKDGWIAKEFTSPEEEVKQDEAVKGWPEFNGAAYGFKVKYPLGWSVQDYGGSGDNDAVIGFSFSELPSTFQSGFFMPIDIKISSKQRESLETPYKNLPQKTVQEVDISGVKGVRYIYTDNADSTEKSKLFINIGAKTAVLSENGGYGQELEQLIKTFKIQ